MNPSEAGLTGGWTASRCPIKATGAGLRSGWSVKPPLKHSASQGGRHDGKDSRAKVFADRKKWIQDWVAEGKTLGRVKAVFDTSLHSEIEDLYWQAVAEAEGAAML